MVRRHLSAPAVACAVALAAASTPAMGAQPGAPMVEPTPLQVMRSNAPVHEGRIARPPAMGQSTHAIMMPHPRMPPGPRGETPARGPAVSPSTPRR